MISPDYVRQPMQRHSSEGPGKLHYMFGRSSPLNLSEKCYVLGAPNAIPDNVVTCHRE